MALWMVSIRNGSKIKNLLIERKGEESDVEVFQNAKNIYINLKNKYPQYTVELVSRKKAFPPKQKIKRGYVYCPYCRVERIFQLNTTTGNLHCTICDISDRDYYVRHYNNLWKRGN